MKDFLQKILGFSDRMLIVYVLAVFFIWHGIDRNLISRERARYLLGVFSNGGLRNELDGILYFDHQRILNPGDPEVYAGLGACYYNLGLYEKANRAYRQALSLDPDSARLRRQHKLVLNRLEAKGAVHGHH